MNVAVAVAIGIIATLLVACFGTLLVLAILFMNRLDKQIKEVTAEMPKFRQTIEGLARHVNTLAPLIEDLSTTFRGVRQDMQKAADATLRSSRSISDLNSLLTNARGEPVESPSDRPLMDGPPPFRPSPKFDREAPPEDGTEVTYTDDEEIAKEEDRQLAREMGYETDPEADFPVPLPGVGVDAE